MLTRRFALIYGSAFVTLGLLGFVPGITRAPHPDDPHLIMSAGYGRLMELFPVNVLHDLAHLGLGAWGIATFWAGGSRLYCRAAAVLYTVLTAMGLIPATSTTFGLVPIFGHDAWFHALSATLSGYFGFIVPRESATVAAGAGATRTAM